MWSGNPVVIAVLGGMGGLLAAAGWLYPRAIAPVFIGLMLITVPIGMVVSEVALFLVYVVVFLPIGLFFRISSRDQLQLSVDRKSSTYWRPNRQPKSVASYYRQSPNSFRREFSMSEKDTPPAKTEFERLSDEDQLSLVSEFVLFIKENKAWWMIPIVLVLGAVGLLVMLSTTGAAPFIYTLF